MCEILAPAGNYECASAAIHAGANAVYLGYSAYSARANAGNFDEAALAEIIRKAHLFGVKVYVAMNTVVKTTETTDFIKTLLEVWNAGADAIIMQDLFLGKYIHERYPEIVLHLSTQAGICTVGGAKFAKACGFSRVILARETPLSEIRKITPVIETEVFVQGALCTAFSGQCYFSSFVGNNSGNRGRCKQPCRKKYSIDRANFDERRYALSLSDLCVGEQIASFLEAGVTSFKIEGRMRRAEYVSAAVSYYRAVLEHTAERESKLSELKRTYNRGNYTQGLAFGQDKRFLSQAVQGHIGEKVGVVKVVNGNYLVESNFVAKDQDAFKILRKGVEVGGATFEKSVRHGFLIRSNVRLTNGDSVFITTDTRLNERLLAQKRTIPVNLSLYFKEGERAIAECGDLVVYSDEPLPTAESRPLTESEIKACFLKTDELPVDVRFLIVLVEGNVFLPKSKLNAFRRSFYECWVKKTAGESTRALTFHPVEPVMQSGKNDEQAVICSNLPDGEIAADVVIYKPDDYTAPMISEPHKGNYKRYLYYPAFLTSEEEEWIATWLKNGDFDGIYAENYGGIPFAKTHGIELFIGTGLNVSNAIAAAEIQKIGANYYALSKEISEREQAELASKNAFALYSGDIKLMDLCYCPFGKTCKDCDKREAYTLTDENGRNFPLRRYLSPNGNCRFEVYNCASLVSKGAKDVGKLVDITTTNNFSALTAQTEAAQKQIYRAFTSGHQKNSVL